MSMRNVKTTLRVAAVLLGMLSFAAHAAEWRHSGQSANNARHQKSETTISPANAHQLQVKWATSLVPPGAPAGTTADVWTTAAVDEEAVYVPTYVVYPDGRTTGFLNKLDRGTGAIIWSREISEYSGKPGDFSRTTPAIAGNLLIIGNQANRFPFEFGAGGWQITETGALVMAVDKNTGDLVWKTEVDDHLFSIVTQSATVFGDTVLVGVSSYESAWPFYAFPAFPGAPALGAGYQESSRGSLLALDKNNGAIKWRTFTTTSEFSGASVWGSAPSIDKKRGQVFIGTGQNFSMPDAVATCAMEFFEGVNPFDRPAVDEASENARGCLEPYDDNHFDSILALDLKTGNINWYNRVVGYDTWHVACLIPGLAELFCPNPSGNDADFGQMPIFFNVDLNGSEKGGKRDVVGVGQKAGIYWLFDAETGETLWSTRVSPGGFAGGIQWGSAYDGERIYTASANSDGHLHILPNGDPTNAGIWSALDPATGEILWQTPSPGNNFFGGDAPAGGAVTVANGVVYACSLDMTGLMNALDASDGNILWSFASNGSCNSGAAVADGTVFWGSGYPALLAPLKSGDKFYAFNLPE